ncbi:ABC transporter permease [Wenzhouxiangella sp. XN201]|uniref:permease-like cell division protein FtsX n=1 Tax=Wenzhouxiangella sp. XN201 TaxID=2710755 RepID=UPI0013C65551|nr:ABC transporter permease [Wenzhouxiangella sp. XN201]
MKRQGSLRAWSRRHAYSLLSSLGALLRQPVASLMTVIVLAITLSLPAGLHLLLDSADRVSANWQRLDTLSIFLDEAIGESDAVRLSSELSTWPTIATVDPISPEQGLAEVTGQLGLDGVAERIESNPLPWVLEISPIADADPGLLAGRLEALDDVDRVIVDLQWLERFRAIVELLERLAAVLAVLFAVAVAFIVGNTIRMDIHNRHEEIRVLALVGATDGFIRRPFLYSGLWYGMAGGALAWLLIEVGLALLAGPVGRLSDSYGSDFVLSAPDLDLIAVLVVGSGLLGILGSWLAVGRHLRRIHPS